jgi:hypothetical protein
MIGRVSMGRGTVSEHERTEAQAEGSRPTFTRSIARLPELHSIVKFSSACNMQVEHAVERWRMECSSEKSDRCSSPDGRLPVLPICMGS